MAKFELTDKEIQKQIKFGPGPKGRRDIADVITTGLCLRLTTDRQTWAYMFTPPGAHWSVRTKFSLGTYPSTGLADARTRAREARSQVEAGIDPRHTQAEPEVAVPTVADLINDRIRLEVRADRENHLDSCLEIERCYDHDVAPLVGTVPVTEFEPKHLNKITNKIIDRGANTQANRTYQHVKALFEFAVRRGEYGIKASPLASCKPPCEENSKERFLTLPEIRQLWNGADEAMERSDLVPDVLRLILATGQRPGEECAAAERSEVDLQQRLWTIPAHKAKNDRDHVVPLNDLAMEIFARRMRLTTGRYLFPNKKDGALRCSAVDHCVERALEPQTARTATRGRTAREALPLGRLGIEKFTPHDLRRTVSTWMSIAEEEGGLEIDDLHIGHVLNHHGTTKKTVTARVYNKNKYLTAKRDALTKWGTFLTDLVGAQTGLRVAA